MDEIVDWESLKASWDALPEDQQSYVALALSFRAAMRVVPLFYVSGSDGNNLIGLALQNLLHYELLARRSDAANLRDYFSIGFQAQMDIRSEQAQSKAMGAIAGPHPIASVPLQLGRPHIQERLLARLNCVALADEALEVLGVGKPEFWAATKFDFDFYQTRNGTEAALWATQPFPLEQEYQRLRHFLKNNISTGEAANFWCDWYEAHLKGEPLNADLVAEIDRAFSAERAIFRSDRHKPAELNRRVMEVYDRHRLAKSAKAAADSAPLSLAPFMVSDGRNTKLDAVPSDGMAFEDVVSQIQRDLDRFSRHCESEVSGNAGPHMRAELGFCFGELIEDIKGATHPTAVVRALQIWTAAAMPLAESGGFKDNPAFLSLAARLERAQEDVFLVAPDALAEDRQRFQNRLSYQNRDIVMRHLEHLRSLPPDLDGLLYAEVVRAFAVLDNPEAGDSEYAHAAHLLRGLAPKLALFIDDTEVAVGGDTYLEAMAKQGKTLSDIDKGVDALQEMGSEWGPWLGRFWQVLRDSGWFGGGMN